MEDPFNDSDAKASSTGNNDTGSAATNTLWEGGTPKYLMFLSTGFDELARCRQLLKGSYVCINLSMGAQSTHGTIIPS